MRNINLHDYYMKLLCYVLKNTQIRPVFHFDVHYRESQYIMTYLDC